MNTLSRKWGALVLSSVAFCSLNACVPIRYVDAPAVAGQVTNRVTKHPVSGATVSMTSDNTVVQARTDQTGSFRLPAIHAWHLPMNYIEGHVMSGVLRVEAVGYHPYMDDRVGAPFSATNPQGLTEPDHDHPVLGPIQIALAPDA